MGCSRNTVRLWLRRFRAQGRQGLHPKSCAPKTCPHKTAAADEAAVLRARARVPCFGPRRLKDLFGLAPSPGAIARILRQHGLSRPRRRRRVRKNDLRALKAAYQVAERLQADTMPLYDIPHYRLQMTRLRLPRHQYSVRDVKSGAVFLDYANELSATCASPGTRRVLHHLQDRGVPPGRVRVSTDNGSEYGGQERREQDRGFPATVREAGAAHRFIPPATPNAHAEVESMHSQIQAELFDLETFSSREDFLNKVATYQLSWNFARPNYSKGGKTPARILAEEGLDPLILLLPPLDLDEAFRTLCRKPPPATGAGEGVPALPEKSKKHRRPKTTADFCTES